MAKIEFRTEWLTQIGLAAKCGTPEEVAQLCVAIQRIAQGQPVGEMSPLVEILFNPIAEALDEERALREARANAGSHGGKQKVANRSKSVANCSKSVANLSKNLAKDSEEREENKEESREEKEEVSPHTPLQEEIEESKGETREEKEEVAPSLDTSNEVSRYGACSESENAASEPAAPPQEPVITIPLNDGSEWPVYPDLISEFSALYPAVDVMQEMRNIRGWCLSNKDKRKTARGVLRFLNTWLSKEQDRGGRQRASPPEPAKRKLTAAEIFALPAINPFEFPGGER